MIKSAATPVQRFKEIHIPKNSVYKINHTMLAYPYTLLLGTCKNKLSTVAYKVLACQIYQQPIRCEHCLET